MSCCSENKCFELRISGWVVSRGQEGHEDGAGEAAAVHVSSTLYCPYCHTHGRGRANDGIESVGVYGGVELLTGGVASRRTL